MLNNQFDKISFSQTFPISNDALGVSFNICDRFLHPHAHVSFIIFFTAANCQKPNNRRFHQNPAPFGQQIGILKFEPARETSFCSMLYSCYRKFTFVHRKWTLFGGDQFRHVGRCPGHLAECQLRSRRPNAPVRHACNIDRREIGHRGRFQLISFITMSRAVAKKVFQVGGGHP